MPKPKGKGTSQFKKKCVKPTSYPCGFTCIARRNPSGSERVCHNPLKKQAATFTLWLAEQEKRLAKVNAHRTAKGRATYSLNDSKLGLVKDKLSATAKTTEKVSDAAIASPESVHRKALPEINPNELTKVTGTYSGRKRIEWRRSDNGEQQTINVMQINKGSDKYYVTEPFPVKGKYTPITDPIPLREANIIAKRILSGALPPSRYTPDGIESFPSDYVKERLSSSNKPVPSSSQGSEKAINPSHPTGRFKNGEFNIVDQYDDSAGKRNGVINGSIGIYKKGFDTNIVHLPSGRIIASLNDANIYSKNGQLASQEDVMTRARELGNKINKLTSISESRLDDNPKLKEQINTLLDSIKERYKPKPSPVRDNLKEQSQKERADRQAKLKAEKAERDRQSKEARKIEAEAKKQPPKTVDDVLSKIGIDDPMNRTNLRRRLEERITNNEITSDDIILALNASGTAKSLYPKIEKGLTAMGVKITTPSLSLAQQKDQLTQQIREAKASGNQSLADTLTQKRNAITEQQRAAIASSTPTTAKGDRPISDNDIQSAIKKTLNDDPTKENDSLFPIYVADNLLGRTRENSVYNGAFANDIRYLGKDITVKKLAQAMTDGAKVNYRSSSTIDGDSYQRLMDNAAKGDLNDGSIYGSIPNKRTTTSLLIGEDAIREKAISIIKGRLKEEGVNPNSKKYKEAIAQNVDSVAAQVSASRLPDAKAHLSNLMLLQNQKQSDLANLNKRAESVQRDLNDLKRIGSDQSTVELVQSNLNKINYEITQSKLAYQQDIDRTKQFIDKAIAPSTPATAKTTNSPAHITDNSTPVIRSKQGKRTSTAKSQDKKEENAISQHKPFMTEEDAIAYTKDSVWKDRIFFHGCRGVVAKKIIEKGVEPTKTKTALYGMGFYVGGTSVDETGLEIATKYAMGDANPKTLEMRLNIKKPLIFKSTQEFHSTIKTLIEKGNIPPIKLDMKSQSANKEYANGVRDYFKSQGYDALYLGDLNYAVIFDASSVAVYNQFNSFSVPQAVQDRVDKEQQQIRATKE